MTTTDLQLMAFLAATAPPHRYSEQVLHRHLRALERLDTGGSHFFYTMPDIATENALDVARWYVGKCQGYYYVDQYQYV